MKPNIFVIIDNNEIDLYISNRLIQICFPGVQVFSYLSFSSALIKIKQKPTDISVILLALHMPIISGWDCVEQLALYNNEIPTYLISTGFNAFDEVLVGKYAWVRGLISRPLSSDILRQIALENKLLFNYNT